MKIRDKGSLNRKNQKLLKRGATSQSLLDPLEVKEYEAGRVKKGARFGKKWFPENKGK